MYEHNLNKINKMASVLPAGLRNGMKGMDANKYATKKTVAQGMLDIALLTSNASQLKYVLQVGQKHEFYTLLVVLISISLFLQASAMILTIIMSRMSDSEEKMADRLYHVSVGLLTGAIFCDVIKMTFGLDPALSENDLFGNNTIVGALIGIILGYVFNINLEPDQRKAELLNNISLGFTVTVMAVNVVLGIFYSIHVDMQVNPLD